MAESQPFGDSTYIRQRTAASYRRRLELISDQVEWAGQLLNLCDDLTEDDAFCVLGDPALRAVVDAWVASIALAIALPNDVRLTAVIHGPVMDSLNNHVPPLAVAANGSRRLTDKPWPWIWTPDRTHPDPLGQAFAGFLVHHHPALKLIRPEDNHERSLADGRDLLWSVCPGLAASSVAHVHVICLAEADPRANFTSLTDPRLPGVMLLSPAVLERPLDAAEYLLHEALHLKFIDLEHTHSMLVPYAELPDWPTVSPPWHRDGDRHIEWPANRALTVLHVYTGLATFYAALAEQGAAASERADIEQGGDGRLLRGDPRTRSFQAQERARALSAELRAERCQLALGFAGRLFVDWLDSILASLQRAA